MRKFVLVWMVLGACGGGGGGTGASPDAAPTCTPKTCTDLGFDCGAADDGCGGTLACGTCTGDLTCGANGRDNVCDAPCAEACPATFTCFRAACVDGDELALALDVKTVHVSGTITASGQIPTQTCAAPTDVRGQVLFWEESGRGSFTLPIPCAGAADPFTFEGTVFAGVYRVAVMGVASSLPAYSITVDTALEIRADAAGLAWDVAMHHVSGTLTQNGQVPAQPCVAGVNRAQVLLEEKTLGYLFSLPLPCDPPGTPFAFSGSVAPGTYEVSVSGENSSIPSIRHVVEAALVVQGDVDGLAYDLVTYPVSGVVTLNGQVPAQIGTCRSQRGVVGFQSVTGSTAFSIPCAPAGTPFSFSGEIYPGTYFLTAAGTNTEIPRETFRPSQTVT